jgi:hypothetical protein
MSTRRPGRTPNWIPYPWYWGLGAVLVVLALLFAALDDFFVTIGLLFAGAMMMILGFVERGRGAPRR